MGGRGGGRQTDLNVEGSLGVSCCESIVYHYLEVPPSGHTHTQTHTEGHTEEEEEERDGRRETE